MTYKPTFSVTPIYVINETNEYRPAYGISIALNGGPSVSLRVIFDFTNSMYPIVITPWKQEFATAEASTLGITCDLSATHFNALDRTLSEGIMQFIDRFYLPKDHRSALERVLSRITERIFVPLRSELIRESLRSACERVN